MKNVIQVIKPSVKEDRSAFPTELRQALNASAAPQSQPPVGAPTPPPPAVAVPRAVKNQTEENASIQEGGVVKRRQHGNTLYICEALSHTMQCLNLIHM